MQVLPFYDYYELFTLNCRVFVDAAPSGALSNVKKDARCARSIESFVRGDSSALRTAVNFPNLLCRMFAAADLTPNCEQH